MKELIATHNSSVMFRLKPFAGDDDLVIKSKEGILKYFSSAIEQHLDGVEEWVTEFLTSDRFYTSALPCAIEPFDPYTDNVDEWKKQFDKHGVAEEMAWVNQATTLFVSNIMDAAPEIIKHHAEYSTARGTLEFYLTPITLASYPEVRRSIVEAMVLKARWYGKTKDGVTLQENLWPLNMMTKVTGEAVYILR